MKTLGLHVHYGDWLVQLTDESDRLIADLTRTNHYSKSNYTGKAFVNNGLMEITENKGLVSIIHNVTDNAGTIQFESKSFSHTATINLYHNLFSLKRKNLVQEFILEDENGNKLAEITGLLRKEKDNGFLGLFYSPKSLVHAVELYTETLNIDLAYELLLICGFCTRKFLFIDSGES